jgi:tetratricopeptide (TPR) repeat protein
MRAAHQRLLCAVAVVVVCAAPRLALADAAQARAHFDRGRAFFEVSEYRNAIAEFKAAHVEKPDPAFLYNIGECHRRLGEGPEALQFYQRFLATAPAGDKARPIVEQRIAELNAAGVEPKVTPADSPSGGGDNLALNAPPPAQTNPGAALVQTPAPHQEAPPLYTRPWFLITVGVVVVASAVGIWALSRSPEPPGTALGNQSVF